MSKSNDEKENPNADTDLKKAVAFLLSKEMKEYSLEKRKEFLLKKLPATIVEKAIDLFQTVETSVNQNIEEIIKQNKQNTSGNGWWSSLYDLGILSTVLLSSLGTNYLLDLNRNKKNEMFYREVEKKLNDEMMKNIKEMKNEINSQLTEYVPASTFKNEINNQIVEFTQQRGLSLNLSSKSLREDIADIKKNQDSTDKKLKDINVKIENNNLLLKQDLLKDLENMIEENNKKILIKIIENQNKLLAMTSDRFTNLQTKPNQEIIKESDISVDRQIDQKVPVDSNNTLSSNSGVNARSLRYKQESNPLYYEPPSTEKILTDPVEMDLNPIDSYSTIKIETPIKETVDQEGTDLQSVLDSVINSVETEKDKFSIVMQLKNQLSRINEMSKDKKVDQRYYVNLTNKIFQKANTEKLKEFLVKAGFKLESNNKLVYDVSKSNDLEKANLVIEEYEHKFEQK